MNVQELQKAKIMIRREDPFRATVYGGILDVAGKIAKLENREITESDVITGVKKNIKNLSSTIDLVKEGEIVEQYKKEIKILLEFLPEEIDDEILINKIRELTKDMEKSMKSMGKVIGLVKKEFGDSVDMSKVSKFVKEELTKN